MNMKRTFLSLSIAATLGLVSTSAFAEHVCDKAYFHISNDTKAQTVTVVRKQGSSLKGISKNDVIKPGGAQLIGSLDADDGAEHLYDEAVTIAVGQPGKPALLTTTLTGKYRGMGPVCHAESEETVENGDGVHMTHGDTTNKANDAAGVWFHVHDD